VSVLGLAQNSQIDSYEPNEIFPNSPTASELGKFGSYPVNLSTGLPQIEIPLYTIKSGDLEVPIRLKYHASGIKVNQRSSWVGLGWSLDTSGLISLEVRDTPDELEPEPYDLPDISEIETVVEDYPYSFEHPLIKWVTNYSWVKDVYHINLPTVQASFFKSSNGILTFPPNSCQVIEKKSLNDNFLFKIVDKKGIHYFFNDKERSELSKSSSSQGEDYHIYDKKYTSAWLLSKIVDTKGNSLDFTYGNEYNVKNRGENHSISYTWESRIIGMMLTQVQTAKVDPIKKSFSESYSYSNKLQQIDFPNGRIIFVTNTDANYDGVDNGDGIYLDKIVIEKGNNISGFSTFKIFDFNYSITGEPLNNFTTSFQDKYRFKLDNILEYSGPEFVKEIAKFDYSEIQLPPPNSYKLDFFGYFNNQSNGNLIPKHSNVFFSIAGKTPTKHIVGSANRFINPNKMQAGILKKITYPTKGSTLFEYEPNSFYGQDFFSMTLEDRYINPVSLSLRGEGDGRNRPPSPDVFPPILVDGELPYAIQSKSFELASDKSIEIVGAINCHQCDYKNKYAFANILVLNNGTEKLNITENVTYYGKEIDKRVSLEPGDVHIILSVYGDDLSAYLETFYYKQDYDYLEENVQGYGLRIKSITNYDEEGQFLNQKEFEYTVPNSTNSSGRMTNKDQEFNLKAQDFYSVSVSRGCSYPQIGPDITVRKTGSLSSSSRLGVENNSISYEYVTEIEKDVQGNTNGKTMYHYSFLSDKYYELDKGAIRNNNSYLRGQLLEKKVYKKNGNLLSKTNNYFSNHLNLRSERREFKAYLLASGHSSVEQVDCIPYSVPSLPLSFRFYDVIVRKYWNKKDSTSTTNYFYDKHHSLSDSLVKTQKFTYNANNQEIAD